MSDRRMEDDDSLFPETKYKGLLYDPKKQHVGDDDLTIVGGSRRVVKHDKPRRARRERRGTENQHVTKRLTVPENAARRKRGKVVSAPLSKRVSANSGSLREGNTRRKKDGGSFLGDRVLRNAIVLCAVIAIVSVIAIPTSFAKPTMDIRLNDGGRVLEASTAAQTVQEFLDDNKITLGEDDILEIDPGSPITENMEIIIRRAMPVTINSGSKSITINMVTGTVQDALDKAGVVPDEHDEVYPSPDSYIRAGMKIDHIVVQVGERTEYREIPYDKTEREDTSLAKGTTEIAQYGENGELELKFEQVYKNGMMISEELVSEEVIKEPITEITSVGTYVPPPPKKKTVKMSDIKKGGSSGGSVTLDDGAVASYQISLSVTAYCSACNSGSKTASGAYPSYGTVAANLGQLPMGTKLFIPGYGYGVVQDSGGFGPGVIDVYLGERSTCTCGSEWGRKTVTVSVF